MKRLFPLFFAVLTLASCVNWNDMAIRRPLRPEDTREYSAQGAFVYLTVETVKDGPVNGLVIMFRDGPDLAFPVSGGIEGFLIDQDPAVTGISRIAVRHNSGGTTKEMWFLDTYSLTLESNRVNYLGRLAVDEIPGQRDLRLTNAMEKDRERFRKSFPELTNYDFVLTEPKKD